MLDPFEGAGRDFQGLLQVRQPIKRLTDPVLNIIADSEVVGVKAFVHVHCNEPLLFGGQLDNFVRFLNIQAQRLFRYDVRAAIECGQNHFCVQMVGHRHGDHVQFGKVAKQLLPRSLAGVCLGLLTGPGFEILRRAVGGLFCSRGNGDQFELDLCQIASPPIQTHSAKLRSNASALQVSVSAQMNIAAEHAGAYQGDSKRVFHDNIAPILGSNLRKVYRSNPPVAMSFRRDGGLSVATYRSAATSEARRRLDGLRPSKIARQSGVALRLPSLAAALHRSQLRNLRFEPGALNL